MNFAFPRLEFLADPSIECFPGPTRKSFGLVALRVAVHLLCFQPSRLRKYSVYTTDYTECPQKHRVVLVEKPSVSLWRFCASVVSSGVFQHPARELPALAIARGDPGNLERLLEAGAPGVVQDVHRFVDPRLDGQSRAADAADHSRWHSKPSGQLLDRLAVTPLATDDDSSRRFTKQQRI